MTRPDASPTRAALPIAAIAVFTGFLALTLAVAGETLGYDFLAYHAAATRVLSGESAYDLGFEAAGGFGLFYYPPTFLPLVLPFGVLDAMVATWAWIAVLVAAFGIGVALMPVPRSVQWWTVLLAGLSWPFVYAVKLGQVGPLLFLAFAAGWRWMDEPLRLGVSMAVGTAIKLQPVTLFVWGVLTGRWRAVVYGAAVLIALGIVVALVTGWSAYPDFVQLMRQLGDPITSDNNMAPGAVLYRLGVGLATATLIQWTSVVVVLLLVVVAALRASAEASYLVAVVASQFIWPLVWEHYAMLLLLPVAYLLAAGWRWAILIPLATATLLVTATPALVYPIVFFLTLIATLIAGWRSAQASSRAEPSFA